MSIVEVSGLIEDEAQVEIEATVVLALLRERVRARRCNKKAQFCQDSHGIVGRIATWSPAALNRFLVWSNFLKMQKGTLFTEDFCVRAFGKHPTGKTELGWV